MNCEPFARFPLPQTIYETIFAPIQAYFVMSSNSGLYSYLLDKFSLSSPVEEIKKHAFRYPTDPACSSSIDMQLSYLKIMSPITTALAFAIDSTLSYSLIRIAKTMQHRLLVTDWQPGTKIIVSSILSLMPHLIMLALKSGNSNEELLVSIGFTVVLPAIISSIKYANRLKELEEISVTPYFNLAGFISQKFFITARNLLTVSLVLAYMYVKGDIPFNSGHPLEFCLSEDETMKMITNCAYRVNKLGVPMRTPMTYLINTLGKTVGIIVVDALFIGLWLIGIVKDLRDPINSIFRSRTAHEEIVPKVEPKKKTREHRDSLMSNTWDRTTRSTSSTSMINQRTQGAIVDDTLPSPFSYLQDAKLEQERQDLFPQESIVQKKEKVKPRKSTPVLADDNLPKAEIPLKHSIQISGYDREIRKLDGVNLGNFPNVWGMISYGHLNQIDDKLRFYERSLRTGHVGGRSASIKKIGVGGKTKAPCYELRPGSQGDRILGRLIRGEANVYERLKEIMPYEIALELILQMKENSSERNQDIHFIDFYHLIKHDDINKELRNL